MKLDGEIDYVLI